MTSEQVAELEKRAAAAELAIAELKAKLQEESLKNAAAGNNNNAALESKLRQLLDLMREDRQECEAIRAQRDELKEENERLRTQVSKHEYRIKHLLRTINEIESAKQ
ncbi:uncharacterized protein TM35_000082020 [Trypanosoma theileri]|uniref:Uncharacterized protein n=1 Tax=Trypanosoma theileri TaxID=67003 RepID=A0A1X0P0D5_9TRYP|nr:uncharacterized protein TM35_000082020 [Trypanosoma theileri]ORC90404.1 hypothetical protein TM35_000082020 [Trypanosoma theileri]